MTGDLTDVTDGTGNQSMPRTFVRHAFQRDNLCNSHHSSQDQNHTRRLTRHHLCCFSPASSSYYFLEPTRLKPTNFFSISYPNFNLICLKRLCLYKGWPLLMHTLTYVTTPNELIRDVSNVSMFQLTYSFVTLLPPPLFLYQLLQIHFTNLLIGTFTVIIK